MTLNLRLSFHNLSFKTIESTILRPAKLWDFLILSLTLPLTTFLFFEIWGHFCDDFKFNFLCIFHFSTQFLLCTFFGVLPTPLVLFVILKILELCGDHTHTRLFRYLVFGRVLDLGLYSTNHPYRFTDDSGLDDFEITHKFTF